MAKVTTYKHSKLATVINVIGYFLIILGIYCLFNDQILGGIITVILGIGAKMLAAYIAARKKKKDDEMGIHH